jgi:hypothetical protein
MRNFVALVLLTAAAFAKPHAPLPTALLHAKTVYIQNQSGEAKLLDDCYTEIQEWNRLTIIDRPEDADVIVILSKSSSSSSVSGSTTKVREPTANNSDGGYQNVSHGGAIVNYVYVTMAWVGRDKQLLWSHTARWKWIWSHPTQVIIDELRKRIDEQERH